MTRPFKLNARQRRALGPILGEPIPTHADVNRPDGERSDSAKLRSALTRFEKKHGADALISLMKIELQKRGEERWRIDKLAPAPGQAGQTSLLDAGR